jgi:heterodisulfide reductase subunit A-like polyferredoxin/coenzyme F420-reducing hydrogenase delta subunit
LDVGFPSDGLELPEALQRAELLLLGGGDVSARRTAVDWDLVEAWVRGGGSLVATCAGAYLLRAWADAGVANSVAEPPEGAPPRAWSECEEGIVVHPVRGPVKLRSEGGATITAPIYGGPVFSEPGAGGARVAARYAGVTRGAEWLLADRPEMLEGTPAVLVAPLGEGMVVLSGPHLEHPDHSPAHLWLAALLDREPGTPREGGPAPTTGTDPDGEEVVRMLASVRGRAMSIADASWRSGGTPGPGRGPPPPPGGGGGLPGRPGEARAVGRRLLRPLGGGVAPPRCVLRLETRGHARPAQEAVPALPARPRGRLGRAHRGHRQGGGGGPRMIGVFLCDCGTNIAGAVDLDRVQRALEGLPGLRVYRHPFMCSDDGQDAVRRALDGGEVDRVVVAACSPRHHGDVFREAVEGHGEGHEPVLANIREHCAWVTPDVHEATAKAVALVRAAVARAGSADALGTFRVPVEGAVAVVGGGVTGMHAALELASSGVEVHLIEREPSLGGVMLLLDRTFPTDDCALCSLAPVLSDVARQHGITVHTLAEVTGVRGRPGDWTITVTKRPRNVSVDRCIACGACTESDFEPGAPMLPDAGRRLIDRIAVGEGACSGCGSCVQVCEAATGGTPALGLDGEGRLAYDTRRCVGCWDCLEECQEGALRRVSVCPVVVPSETDRGLGWRHAIHLPSPHAVPLAYVRDADNCLALNGELECRGCHGVCPADAVVDGAAEEVELRVGAMVLATGLREADLGGTEYHPEHPDVVTALQLERLLSPDGPSGGRLVRPSDGEPPRRVVFVQCAGSRSERHHPHCSKVCCSHAVKNASLVRARHPGVEVTVCYTDIRVAGPGAEEYYDRARKGGVRFLRGSVAEVDVSGDRPVVVTEDTLAGGGRMELEADLVVLSTALLPSEGAAALLEVMPMATDPQGFYRPVHPKMRPVDMAVRGVHAAGSAEGPKFVQECIADAGAAAARAEALVASGELELPRAYPDLDVERCIGCGLCISECPFGAMEAIEDGRVRIVEAACRACGKCAAACLSTALDLRELPNPTLRAEVDAMVDAARAWRDADAEAGNGAGAEPAPGATPVVVYACNSCGYNAADLAGSRRMEVPAQALPVWVPCSGRLSVDDLVYPFTRGAAGVLVAACLPQQCAFVDGNVALSDRLDRARALLALSGIDPDRLQLVHTSSADAAAFRDATQRMARVARRAPGGDDG